MTEEQEKVLADRILIWLLGALAGSGGCLLAHAWRADRVSLGAILGFLLPLVASATLLRRRSPE